MAKRFIDSSFFRKDFVKGLDVPYKLLWMYLISECDHAGLWDVEIEVAEIRLGVKFKTDPLKVMGEKVIPIDNGTKWFIPSFVEFQYGTLKPENRAHASVIFLLQRYNLLNEDYSIKPLTSPLQGGKDMDKDKEKDKVRDMDKERANEIEEAITEVLECYNLATERKIDVKANGNRQGIRARLKEGIKKRDLIDMTDYKACEWMGGEFEKFLTTETLYGVKHCLKYIKQMQHAKDKGLTASQIKGNQGRDARVFKEDLTEQALRALAFNEAKRAM